MAIGLVFGVLVRLGDAGTGAVPWLANVGGPWIAVAFAIGWWSRERPAGAGVACLIAAVLAKYAWQVGQGDIAGGALIVRLAAWGVASVVVGSVFGAAGASARRGAWWPWTLVCATLAVESGSLLSGIVDGESAHLRYDGQAGATAVFVVELVVAGAAATVAVVVGRAHARRSGAVARRGSSTWSRLGR